MLKCIAVAAALSATAAGAADLPITTKTTDEALVAYLRFEGQYTDVAEYMEKLHAAVGDDDVGPYMGLYYDGPEEPVHDIEVCVPVEEELEKGGVKTRKLPGGTYARTVHLGPYETVGETWMRLGSFVHMNGLGAEGPGMEIYLAWDPANAANNVTELLIPVSRPVEPAVGAAGPSNRVIHFEIPADDPARAVAFYAGAFGWKIEQWENDDGEPVDYWLCYTGTGAGIDGGLYKRTNPGDVTKFTVAVADFDAAVKALKEAGGKIVAPKVPVPGVGWQGYVVDSEGTIFGIMQFDPTAK
jgi:predicted enzyme related to lactoylglutathione lyase/effector-binding domain-containing protein